MKRRVASIILSVVFGLFALIAWAQVADSSDPPTLRWLQLGIGFAAAATAWGGWRRATWTWRAAIAYGAITAGMLAVLPSLLQLPADARNGIWTGAAGSMLFALLCAKYFRSDARRVAQPNSTAR